MRRLAGSYKKSSVKTRACIFDEFAGVINSFVRRTFEKFLSHQPEANEVQAFSCVLLKNPCRFVTVVNTEILGSIIDVHLRLCPCFQE